jgi:hypothetical protein
LNHMMTDNGKKESLKIKWESTAQKIQKIYLGLLRA